MIVTIYRILIKFETEWEKILKKNNRYLFYMFLISLQLLIKNLRAKILK